MMRLQRFFTSRLLVMLLLLFFGFVVIIVNRTEISDVKAKHIELSLEVLALRTFTYCKDKKYRPTCYDEQIPKLMKTLSMEESFAVTRIVQDMDPTYSYCHVLAHKLSAQEVARDPSKWKEVVTRCPSGTCSNGCLHGGFQEKFRKQTFTDADIERYMPDLQGICEARGDWKPTGVEQASCYHAIGHLTMYITNGEVQKSLPLCDVIAKKEGGRDYTMLCYDGVFMQIFQPLEADDFSLVEGKQPTKESVFAYCSTFSLAAQASCVNESWPLFRNEIMTPEGFYAHCANSPTDSGKEYCYTALSYIVTPRLRFEPEKTSAFCEALPEAASYICYKNAATRMIETDTRNISKAVALCRLAPTGTVQNGCYHELAVRAIYYLGKDTPGAKELCSALPKQWEIICSLQK